MWVVVVPRNLGILTLDWGLLGIRLDWTWDLGIELGLEKKQRIKNILS